MARHATTAPRLDERLGELLGVERRLEAQVRQAKAEAAQRVADARADGERARAEARRHEAERAKAEAEEDRAAHAAALERLEAEHRAVMAWLAGVPDALVERLARRALARAAGLPGEGGP